MKKAIISILAVLIVGIGAFLVLRDTPEQATNGKWIFNWEMTDAGTDQASGTPRTKVAVKYGDKVRTVGTYDGSCAEIGSSSWTLLDGEKTGVICWWAGGGKELGIFEENGKLVLKAGDLDEGSDEVAGFRGNFVKVFEI